MDKPEKEQLPKIISQAEAHVAAKSLVPPDVEGEMRRTGSVVALRFYRAPHGEKKVVWADVTLSTTMGEFVITILQQRDLELFPMNQEVEVIIRPLKAVMP